MSELKIHAAKEEKFESGDKVYLKSEYADNPSERFILSQWDGQKGWISDSDGLGWYVCDYQITKKKPQRNY